MESTEIYLLADGVLVKASFVNFREIWSGAIADFMGSVFSKQDFLHAWHCRQRTYSYLYLVVTSYLKHEMIVS